MMTHTYYGNGVGSGGDYDNFYRSDHRHMSRAAYYDRNMPYGYYEQTLRYDNRSEYPGRPGVRTMIHEPDEPAAGEQRTRKRISVACRRCRKRKIKCSGDMGDGLGCSACRHAGADGAQCAFIRVGAKECCEVLPGVEITPMTSSMNATPTSNNMESNIPCSTGVSNVGYGTASCQSHRPSLPTLHTRSTYPTDYESQFENASLDGYSYAPSTIPRQDSFASAYGLENYRCWSTTAPISAPITATYYEPIPSYSFGSLQTPSFPQLQQHSTRLPSVTAESFSPFHMSHLNSSLPSHTAHERRLPIPALPAPYTLQYPPPQPAMPQIRPLGSYTEPRVHINGIHSHHALPFSLGTHSSGSRAASISSYAPTNGLPMSSAQQSTPAMSEPVLGYQFTHTAADTGSSSPEISPTSGAVANESFSSSSSTSSMAPPPTTTTFRYPLASTSSASASALYGGGLTPALGDERPSGSRVPASLFSFSTESSEGHATGNEAGGNNNDDDEDGMSVRGNQNHNHHSNFQLRHHQQHQHQHQHQHQQQLNHAASAEAFQRRSSYEEQRASTAHRMSLSNLNAKY